MNQERLLDSKNVLIIYNYHNDGKRLWRWQWQWYWDQFFHSISWLTIAMTVGLTHRPYWCSSTYVKITLTLLNLNCLAFEWLFFSLVNIFRWIENKKFQIFWFSYGLISGNLASSGINFLNPNSPSQKATKMS